MAMSKCRECGHEISTKAKNCPSCGVASPARKPGKRLLIGLALLFVLLLVYNLGGSSSAGTPDRPAPEHDPDFGRFVIDQGKVHMAAQLRDPSSVQWGTIEARVAEQDGKAAVFACGSYTATSGRSRRFFSNGTPELTFDETMGSEFSGTWDLMCSGRVLAREGQ